MKGFTLVETLVAAAVAAALIAGAGELLARAALAGNRADAAWEAAEIAAAKAEEMKARAASGEPPAAGAFFETTRGPDGRREFRTDWAVSSAGGGLTLVEISVAPAGGPARRPERLAVFISAALGFAP